MFMREKKIKSEKELAKYIKNHNCDRAEVEDLEAEFNDQGEVTVCL